MLGLRDHQRAVAAELMSAEGGIATALLAVGGIPGADRLRVHHNTMLTALINALALTYPVVVALVGELFFAQTARAFILGNPPRTALLTNYGAAFPDFVGDCGLRYLPDVARLEWAVERAARCPLDNESLPLADLEFGGTRLALIPSLTLLQVGYRVEPIWRAVLDNDIDALDRIDPSPAVSMLAIWRNGDSAAIAPLGLVSAAFLEELIAGGDAEKAINAAAAADPGGDPLVAITSEILPAAFARLLPQHSKKETSHADS